MFDAIVIGSGFGGAITACRMAEAGMSVLVLERGRRWNKNTFPRQPADPWWWSHEEPERQNGWIDLRVFKHSFFNNMSVAQGAGVGGGSLIYANISCEAPESAFASGWPAAITHAALKPHYDRVADVMDVRPLPAGQATDRFTLVKDAAAAAGFGDRFTPLPLAVNFDPDWTYAKDFERGEAASIVKPNKHGAEQGTCVHLGTCDIGCKVNARNTLDLNYLFIAETRHHADIRPLHLVDRIEPRAGGYDVHFDRLENNTRVPGVESGRIVVVAAGSLASTELLLRNRDVHHTLPLLSAALGRNWSSNGDFLTPTLYPGREINPSRGPTITASIDFEDGSVGNERFWVQDGGFPNLLLSYLDKKADDPSTGFKERTLLQAFRRLAAIADPAKHVMPWFAQGIDAGNGTLSLTPDGRLQMTWDPAESAGVIEAIIAMHKRLAARTGGMPLVPPTWTLFRDLVTPHPLGGCGMGDTAATGVVDARGEAFGHPGLYVADGAIVPRAIGVNPSRTIAALAEHIASDITAH